MRGKWKGSEEESGEEGWRVSGVSLDKGLVRKTRGKTVRLPVPGWDKLARSSEWANVFISKPVEQWMPRTNQQAPQFACIKRKIPSASKNYDLPWSIWAGVRSSGFTELVCGSITQKQHFKGFEELWGLSFFPDFNTTDSNIDSPADTCGCGVPEGLKMSLVSPPPLIRAWWKTAVYQSSSVH